MSNLDQDYDIAQPAPSLRAKVKQAASILAPESVKSNLCIYERKDRSEQYWGNSCALAYLLAFIHCSRKLQLKNVQRDIWCTGCIELAGKETILETVTPAEFEKKLEAFLLDENPDKLFIVPDANIDYPLRRDHIESRGEVGVISVSDFSMRSLRKRKIILTVCRDELRELVDHLFDQPGMRGKMPDLSLNPHRSVQYFYQEDEPVNLKFYDVSGETFLKELDFRVVGQTR